MNMQAQIQDFGYQDFILVQSPSASVLSALRAVIENRENVPAEPTPERPKGLMRRALSILNRSKHEPGAEPTESLDMLSNPAPFQTILDGETALEPSKILPFQVYRGRAADHAGQILTSENSVSAEQNPAFAPLQKFTEDVRVSTLRAAPDWTLIEFRDTLSEICPMAQELSAQMGDVEILYFRRSGDVATDVHFDFHVYSDGKTTRRVSCRSAWPEDEDAFEEVWTGHSEGDPTRYEAESYDADASEMDLLDEVKQETILAYLGLSYDNLFRSEAKNDPVLITRRDGGEPLATL